MDIRDNRHKTLKKQFELENETTDTFIDTLKIAYSRPWHRLERGLRLNRIKNYVEYIAPLFNLTEEERIDIFAFLKNNLDKKLLNTSKIVVYDIDTQRIDNIRGLEIRRQLDGKAKWGFSAKKTKADMTRKKKIEPENVLTCTISEK